MLRFEEAFQSTQVDRPPLGGGLPPHRRDSRTTVSSGCVCVCVIEASRSCARSRLRVLSSATCEWLPSHAARARCEDRRRWHFASNGGTMMLPDTMRSRARFSATRALSIGRCQPSSHGRNSRDSITGSVVPPSLSMSHLPPEERRCLNRPCSREPGRIHMDGIPIICEVRQATCSGPHGLQVVVRAPSSAETLSRRMLDTGSELVDD